MFIGRRSVSKMNQRLVIVISVAVLAITNRRAFIQAKLPHGSQLRPSGSNYISSRRAEKCAAARALRAVLSYRPVFASCQLITVKKTAFHPLIMAVLRKSLFVNGEIYSSDFLNFSKLLKSRVLDGVRDSKLVSILHLSIRRQFDF